MQHTAHLFPTPTGLALAGEIIAPRNPDGSFVFAEAKIHALLSAAYGKTISSRAMSYVKRGSELLAQVSDAELDRAAYPYFPNPHAQPDNGFSPLTKGLMMLALAGLGDMEDFAGGKARLVKMQRALLKDDSGDDSEDDSDDEEDDDSEDDGSGSGDDSAGSGNGHYNPDEPRVPAGNPGGGEWTSGDDASSGSESISADDIRSAIEDGMDNPSRLPQGTDVAANDTVQSDAAPSDAKAPASSLSLSNDGLNFIIQYEKFSPAVYQDQAGYDTIGYGHKLTDDESYPEGITREQATQLLTTDVAQAEKAVQQNVTVNLTQSQFDALVSLTYNEGPDSLANSKLLRVLNAGDFNAAANEFANWNKITINGVKIVSQGLIRRRNDEKNMFLTGSN